MSGRKLRVVWICHFSDSRTRSLLEFNKFSLLDFFFKLLNRQYSKRDFAIWIPNAIKEFEKYDDINLSIIFPHQGVKKAIQQFDINNIHYYCYKSEDDNLFSFVRQHVFKKVKTTYLENRRMIQNIISEIKPDVVHVIGAENPYYSLAALDIPQKTPVIVSVQTLMSEKGFLDNYPIREDLYEYRASVEKEIFNKCDYIGTRMQGFRDFIKNNINPNAKFLDLTLAVGVDVDLSEVNKEYDFVYFAANINKACDDAIEAFALANEKYHNLSLNVSGSYTPEYKSFIDKRIEELGLQKSIFFTGSKNTHEEVIMQIKKSRFALLPLKVDLISGTIREAMACGIPVVTTNTPATPKLNEKRESVLLSEKGDYTKMAKNMGRLLDNPQYVDYIKKNAVETIKEQYSNEHFMEEWRASYYYVTNLI